VQQLLIREDAVQCQICSNEKLERFLDLGEHPPCIFLDRRQLGSERVFRLDVYYCGTCGLVQLGHPVDATVLFGENYHHIAALSASFHEHLRALAASLTTRFRLSPDDLVVDIGSNDGALLEAFGPSRTRILGVDPSDVAEIAIGKGLLTVRKFFDDTLARELVREHGHAKVIAALNTFAHVARLDSFIEGIKRFLTADGVFVSESHYLLDLVSQLQYDFIYHEHSRYYSLRSLVHLFGRFGMDVFDVERIPTHSGSLRVFAAAAGAYPVSPSVRALLAEEESAGLSRPETYRAFAEKVEEHRTGFVALLRELRAAGHTIAGLTFPARAVTLLNFCGIGPETLEYISERSHLKIGKLTPGTHIPVVDEVKLFTDGPEYGLLLSWHIRDEIIPKFKANGFKGKFIIPLPQPTIVG
jgi:SAM-dependent methyltransferase